MLSSSTVNYRKYVPTVKNVPTLLFWLKQIHCWLDMTSKKKSLKIMKQSFTCGMPFLSLQQQCQNT